MKRILLGMALFLISGAVWAQGADTTATPSASPSITPSTTPVVQVIKKWSIPAVPWDDWFKNNTMVTDKTEYVHFFWNAQDFKANFEVKTKKQRLAEAALQMVSRLYPSDATADLVKVDIVYVLERDSYGQPKWDSLQQVAHFEFLKSKTLKFTKSKKEPAVPALQKTFDQFVIY